MKTSGLIPICSTTLLLLAVAIGCSAEPASLIVGPSEPRVRTSLQDAGLAEIADLLADMTNELRKERGIAPLETHPGLSEAARRHSAEMARYGYLDDRTLDGATLRERVPTDFRMSVVAENLFGDARPELDSLTSAKRIFEGWMASDEDRANIEATEAAYFGVAVAVAGDELRAVQIVASAP